VTRFIGPLCLVAASAVAAEDGLYYAIQMNDKPLGHARVAFDDVVWEGKQLRRAQCVTSLKFALQGEERQVVRRSETLVQPETGEPVRYELTETTSGTVRHVECQFAASEVRTWSYAEGSPKGEPAIAELPAKTRILGSNDFAHWAVLLQAASREAENDVAVSTVFLPDAKTTQAFRLVRRPARDVTVRGTPRSCIEWQIEGGGVSLFLDANDAQFVRMDVPGQNTTITLSDAQAVQTAETAGPLDILSRHFAQSNVTFDDFMSVSALQIDIDVSVIGEALTNDPATLTTAMQRFEGTKQESQIQGTVTVRSVRYGGGDVAFPADRPTEPDLQPWLEPSAMIESSDPTIVAQARQLTVDAKSRWQAVLRIAEWVNKEIAYKIADTPSARMALDTRKGDCGPHATLTAAMLRASGVPAKLVGGLVYTPSLGGSFGQHAWVEVHMGSDGWVALDPTTGEHEWLSATHVKLFEGMGGVIPKRVAVRWFESGNRAFAAEPPSARPLAWKIGTEYGYRYVVGEKELGTEKFTITGTRTDGGEGYEVQSTLDIPSAVTAFATRLTVRSNGMPVSYDREINAANGKTNIACRFRNGAVVEKITGSKNLEQEIKIPPGTFCFDNNFIPSFAIICSQLELREGQRTDIRTFHPSSLQLIALKFDVQSVQTIDIGGKKVDCFECRVTPINNTFWITRDGRLVRVTAGGGLVIEVSPVD